MKTSAFTKTYGEHRGLKMPELILQPSMCYAVIGANGSGKSTLAKVLAGILPADKNAPILEKGMSVGYMPQHSFAYRMSVIKNICLSCGKPALAADLMRKLEIEHLAARSAASLSGGEVAKMALARVLMKRCDLMVLDEPTASMDIRSTQLAEKLIADYCRKTACTTLMITHSLQQAYRIAQQVIFLHEGVLVELGPAEELLHLPKHELTREFLRFCGTVH